MNDEYKELYYFLFNKISDMIQELQQLQQQAEEAYIAGFGHAAQSAAQENAAAGANCYVPPKVNVSHVYVPDEYEGEAIARGKIGEQQQPQNESPLARCQTVSSHKMLSFEKRKTASHLDQAAQATREFSGRTGDRLETAGRISSEK